MCFSEDLCGWLIVARIKLFLYFFLKKKVFLKMPFSPSFRKEELLVPACASLRLKWGYITLETLRAFFSSKKTAPHSFITYLSINSCLFFAEI
jgi:hypothetical protein